MSPVARVVTFIVFAESLFIYFLLTGLMDNPVKWESVSAGVTGTFCLLPMGIEYLHQRRNSLELKLHRPKRSGSVPSHRTRFLLQWGPWVCGLAIAASVVVFILQVVHGYTVKTVIGNAVWSVVWVYGLFRILALRRSIRTIRS